MYGDFTRCLSQKVLNIGRRQLKFSCIPPETPCRYDVPKSVQYNSYELNESKNTMKHFIVCSFFYRICLRVHRPTKIVSIILCSASQRMSAVYNGCYWSSWNHWTCCFWHFHVFHESHHNWNCFGCTNSALDFVMCDSTFVFFFLSSLCLINRTDYSYYY